MADIERTASAVWQGDLRSGNGQINTTSGVLQRVGYTYATRFEQAPGTNPEELLAAAHAACYSMAFANTLAKKGYRPEMIDTRATVSLTPQQPSGFKITKIFLDTHGRVPGLDETGFREIAHEASNGCPFSNLLRDCVTIELHASLVP